jgi:hypothetical protein
MVNRSLWIVGFLALGAVSCAIAFAAPEARPPDPTAEARLKLARKFYQDIHQKRGDMLGGSP